MSAFIVCYICQAGRLSEAQAQTVNSEAGNFETYVITASKLLTPLNKTASSVSVIESKQIENSGQTNVLDLLKSQNSVDVVRNGGLGGTTAVFVRGANAEHTLILIDGVEANNPINPTRAFNLADLTLDNVERVEILRGPQSTLYGSDALGGVINIITKKGAAADRAYVETEAGSYSTFREKIGFSGASESFNYALAGSRQDSHGISSANAALGNSEKDGYENSSVSGNAGFKLNEMLDFQGSARYVRAHDDLDDNGGRLGDDPNRRLRNEMFFSRAAAQTHFFSGDLEQSYSLTFNHQNLDDDNDPDSAHPLERLRSSFTGQSLKLEHQSVVKVSSEISMLFGLETEQERGSSVYLSDGEFGPFNSYFNGRSARTNGYFSELRTVLEQGFFASAGVRIDDHSQFGSEVTWRVAPGYLIESSGTKLSSTVGTGFKAPSLFQLYSDYGNPELQPEESIGVDASVEQQLGSQSNTLGLTFFFNDFSNLISFDANTFRSQNIRSAETKGLELWSRFTLSDQIQARATYTYTESEDRSDNSELLRRPRNKLGLNLDYQVATATQIGLEFLYVGKRVDNDFSSFTPVRVNLGGYPLLSLVLNHTFDSSIKGYVRVDNLFDREYEEVLGFGTPGLGAYVGLKLSL